MTSVAATLLIMLYAPIAHFQTTSEESEMTINMRETPVRSKPKAYGKYLYSMKEGDAVLALERKGSWIAIARANGGKGWIHKKAVIASTHYIPSDEFLGKHPDNRADTKNYAVAKGFNPKMEQEYQTKKNLNKEFRLVDAIESSPAFKSNAKAREAKLLAFRKKGKLGEFSK